MTEKISQKELKAWKRRLFGNALPGTNREIIRWAGQIANASGKVVEVNGINIKPDYESFDWGKLLMAVVIIVGVIVIVFVVP